MHWLMRMALEELIHALFKRWLKFRNNTFSYDFFCKYFCPFLAEQQIRKCCWKTSRLLFAIHWQQIYVRKLLEMSIWEVTCNENVTWYKVDLPSPTMHSHNNMAATTFVRLRTAESLLIVTSHPQMVGSNKKFKIEVGKDPGCRCWPQQESTFSFRSWVKKSWKSRPGVLTPIS